MLCSFNTRLQIGAAEFCVSSHTSASYFSISCWWQWLLKKFTTYPHPTIWIQFFVKKAEQQKGRKQDGSYGLGWFLLIVWNWAKWMDSKVGRGELSHGDRKS